MVGTLCCPERKSSVSVAIATLTDTLVHGAKKYYFNLLYYCNFLRSCSAPLSTPVSAALMEPKVAPTFMAFGYCSAT